MKTFVVKLTEHWLSPQTLSPTFWPFDWPALISRIGSGVVVCLRNTTCMQFEVWHSPSKRTQSVEFSVSMVEERPHWSKFSCRDAVLQEDVIVGCVLNAAFSLQRRYWQGCSLLMMVCFCCFSFVCCYCSIFYAYCIYLQVMHQSLGKVYGSTFQTFGGKFRLSPSSTCCGLRWGGKK